MSTKQVRLDPAFLGFAALLVDIAKGGRSSTTSASSEPDCPVPEGTNQDPITQINTK
jgi:hypothetical protein